MSSADADDECPFPLVAERHIGAVSQPPRCSPIKTELSCVNEVGSATTGAELDARSPLADQSEQQPSSLLEESGSTTAGTAFTCPLCPRGFQLEKHYTSHVVLHVRQDHRKRECPRCKALFSEWKCVVAHLRKEHGVGGEAGESPLSTPPKRRRLQVQQGAGTAGHSTPAKRSGGAKKAAGKSPTHVSNARGRLVTTRLGALALHHDGHRYYRETGNIKGDTLSRWQCCQVASFKCGVSVKSSADGSKVYVSPNTKHTHGPQFDTREANADGAADQTAEQRGDCVPASPAFSGTAGSFVPGRRGSRLLLHNGYKYWGCYVDADGSTIWKCVRRQSEPAKCPGTAKCSADASVVHVLKGHNHPAPGEDNDKAVRGGRLLSHMLARQVKCPGVAGCSNDAASVVGLPKEHNHTTGPGADVSVCIADDGAVAGDAAAATPAPVTTTDGDSGGTAGRLERGVAGGRVLTHMGHRYHACGPGSWTCARRQAPTTRCPGAVRTEGADGSGAVLVTRGHNHPPGPGPFKCEKKKRQSRFNWTLSGADGKFVRSKQGGHRLLLHNGHLYLKDKPESAQVCTWRCSKWLKYQCGAKVKCANDGSALHISQQHTHSAGTVRVVRIADAAGAAVPAAQTAATDTAQSEHGDEDKNENKAAIAPPADGCESDGNPNTESVGHTGSAAVPPPAHCDTSGASNALTFTEVAATVTRGRGGAGRRRRRATAQYASRDGTATLMIGARGARLLTFDGHMYALNARNVKVMYWCCFDRARFRCKAMLKCSYEGRDVHTMREHNHRPVDVEDRSELAEASSSCGSSKATFNVQSISVLVDECEPPRNNSAQSTPRAAVAQPAFNSHASDRSAPAASSPLPPLCSPTHKETSVSSAADASSVGDRQEQQHAPPPPPTPTVSKCTRCSLATGAGWPMCRPCFAHANDDAVAGCVSDSLECATATDGAGAAATPSAAQRCVRCKLAAGAQWHRCFACFANAAGEPVAQSVKEAMCITAKCDH